MMTSEPVHSRETAPPLSDTPGRSKLAAPASLPAETANHYPAIVYLSDRVRVINCRQNMQWIVQRDQGEGKWYGASFCVTREALIRDSRRRLRGYDGPGAEIPFHALAILRALPEWHPDRTGEVHGP